MIGRPLLEDVSFRLGQGTRSALIGPNGAGKTTLLRMLAGEVDPDQGAIGRSGGCAIMHQFIGRTTGELTVRQLLSSVASEATRAAALSLAEAESSLAGIPSEAVQLAYAQALSDWADTGGYLEEALWDECCMAALGQPFSDLERRRAGTLSGGEQKRLVLEALLRGDDPLLLLDEPDNFLDVPSKRWLEERLRETGKTVLLISHDRELLARCAQRIITLEDGRCWVHGEGFESYAEARRARSSRLEEMLRRWQEERDRLRLMVRTLREQARISADMASRYHAAETRLERFEEAGPPQAPPSAQVVSMRLGGSRTGVKVLTCAQLELVGLMRPFDLELYYGDRLAVLGPNGSGKSRFLQLLTGGIPGREAAPGDEVPHRGQLKLGARVTPGYFSQTQEAPWLGDLGLLEILSHRFSLGRGPGISALRRYELDLQASQRFETLSGGQKARFQILALELSGANLLVLDEPTGNLDLVSSQALEDGLAAFTGTVVAVTHDRWFARAFTRFAVFDQDGTVRESEQPEWEIARVARPAS